MEKPILTLPRFVNAVSALDQSLKRYKFTKRGIKLSDEAFESLRERSSTSLQATNAKSRIVVAATADWQLKELLGEKASAEKLFWITVTPGHYTLPPYAARSFRPIDFRADVAGMLEGIDYFGMIDVAYYPRPRRYMIRQRGLKPLAQVGPAFSYHAHLLAWGCSIETIQCVKSDVNGSLKPFIPDREVFYYDVVSPKTAIRKNIYLLKPPLRSYAAWSDMEEVYGTKTGEIFWRTKADWQHKKRLFRPGEAAALHNEIHNFKITDLMFGGGEGLALKRRVIAIARGRLEFSYLASLMFLRSGLDGRF